MESNIGWILPKNGLVRVWSRRRRHEYVGLGSLFDSFTNLVGGAFDSSSWTAYAEVFVVVISPSIFINVNLRRRLLLLSVGSALRL